MPKKEYKVTYKYEVTMHFEADSEDDAYHQMDEELNEMDSAEFDYALELSSTNCEFVGYVVDDDDDDDDYYASNARRPAGRMYRRD